MSLVQIKKCTYFGSTVNSAVNERILIIDHFYIIKTETLRDIFVYVICLICGIFGVVIYLIVSAFVIHMIEYSDVLISSIRHKENWSIGMIVTEIDPVTCKAISVTVADYLFVHFFIAVIIIIYKIIGRIIFQSIHKFIDSFECQRADCRSDRL